MRHQTALPRISREGFVPAGPEKRINKRHMLIPKTGDPTEDIPRLFDFSEVICPAERRALREIVETAEVVRQDGHVYLTARVSAATLDSWPPSRPRARTWRTAATTSPRSALIIP